MTTYIINGNKNMSNVSVIKKGQTIAFFAPAWWVSKQRIDKAKEYIENLGFEVYIPKQVFLKNGQIAGTVKQRCEALYELLENPEIKAILCVGGGYGCLQLIDKLDYKKIAKNIKPIIGYSDVTVLLNSIYKKTGMVTYHGAMANTFSDKPNKLTDASFIKTLTENIKEIDFFEYNNSRLIQKGKGEGVIVGGNMTVFDQLIGTPYMPKDKNIILFLEDTANEKVNELDKKLIHLKHAGILNNVRGVILAGMEDLTDNEVPFGFSIAEIIKNYLPVNIPVISNVPCGHGEVILTIPIGKNVILDGMKLKLL